MNTQKEEALKLLGEAEAYQKIVEFAQEKSQIIPEGLIGYTSICGFCENRINEVEEKIIKLGFKERLN